MNFFPLNWSTIELLSLVLMIFSLALLMLSFFIVRTVKISKGLNSIGSELSNDYNDSLGKACPRSDLIWIKGELERIRRIIDNKIIFLDSRFFLARNPLALTKKGMQFSDEFGAFEIINRNWIALYSVIKEEISILNTTETGQFVLLDILGNPTKYIDSEGMSSLRLHAELSNEPLDLYFKIIGVMVHERLIRQLSCRGRFVF
ncbi:MAG: hypothetical protein LWX70_02855 [Sphingobacteriia bacterium]|nr:hypothetical protein [Sphingobacteriia bacterium]